MIINTDKVQELNNYIEFHKPIHKELSIYLLEKIAGEITYKLKVQKASIQLMNPMPFAVIGLRRSKDHVFIEFYSNIEIDNSRIEKIIPGKNGYLINRINISQESEIDTELINFIVYSKELINEVRDF